MKARLSIPAGKFGSRRGGRGVGLGGGLYGRPRSPCPRNPTRKEHIQRCDTPQGLEAPRLLNVTAQKTFSARTELRG